jgi:methylated-DNA-[protein]-cysteine S-methyltransferase
MTLYTTLDSPIGELLLAGDEQALCALSMLGGRRPIRPAPQWRRADAPFAEARQQLAEYFAGDRTAFDLVLAPRGSAFQLAVWAALRAIPYGQTRTYGEIAAAVGRPDAVRAVGAANGANPIAVIVPCHRVIGADGSLTGFGGGLERKRALLDLESGRLSLQPAA